MKRTLSCCRGVILLLPAAVVSVTFVSHAGAFDWREGPWGIRIVTNGTPRGLPCTIAFPGGSTNGDALEVYYELSSTNLPQFWVFLTDGFWRQVAPGSEFLTSYRLFRYWSSADRDRDNPQGIRFEVVEVTDENRLRLGLRYTNNDTNGSPDKFDIQADVLLDPPGEFTTGMTAWISITNVSGRAVCPFWSGHPALREQWIVFAVSTMYVADNLTGGLPAWYSSLDPNHNYVGNVADACYLNDGRSVTQSVSDEKLVSTHDAKYIIATTNSLALHHDMPHVSIPEYEWFTQLVMKDGISPSLLVQHAYDPRRHHRIDLIDASGIASQVDQLWWSTRFNREDTNMVDGDNVQVNLGLDHFLDCWPEGAYQKIHLRLATGEPQRLRAFREGSGLSVQWTAGELEGSTDLNSWSKIPAPSRPFTTNLTNPKMFFRLNLSNVCE